MSRVFVAGTNPDASVHSRVQTSLNEHTLIVSYLPLKTANIRRAKFKRLMDRAINTVPPEDSLAGLSRWCEYDPQNFNVDSFTFMFKYIRPTIFENLEFVIHGSEAPTKSTGAQYRYQVTGTHNGGVVYCEMYETEAAWDFLQIRDDFSGDNDLMLELDKTVYPFEVTFEYNSWRFTDCMGRGFARSLRENIREFWFEERSQCLTVQIVQCVWSLAHNRLLTVMESKPLIAQHFKGFFDNLVELILFARIVRDRGFDEASKLHRPTVVAYLTDFLRSFHLLIGRLLEKKRPVLGLQDFQNVGVMEEIEVETLRQLLIIESNLKKVKDLLITAKAGEELNAVSVAVLDHFSDVDIVKTTYKNISKGLDPLYLLGEDVAFSKIHLENDIDVLYKQMKLVKSKHAELKKKGLPWRSSLSFFSLLQKSLLLRILSTKLPKFKCLNVKNRKVVTIPDCYYETRCFGTQVKVFESELQFIRPKEPVLQLKFPARMNPSQFRLEGLNLLLNIKNRGIQNWGMAIYRVDLSKLKQEHTPLADLKLAVQKLYGYDAMISFSAYHDNLVMVYIKGLICLVGCMDLRQADPEKKIQLHKGKNFFSQLASEGDQDPNLKDVVWAHMTITNKVFRKNVIFMITNYEKDGLYGENMASQRLYSYSINEALEVKPITSRFLPFSRSLFEGRRVEPRHLMIFTVRKLQFVMISSDHLNFHLTAYTNDTFQTINSWTKTKKVLSSWVTNEKKSVMSAWDERKAKMYLYTKDEEHGAHKGLKYMVAQLKL